LAAARVIADEARARLRRPEQKYVDAAVPQSRSDELGEPILENPVPSQFENGLCSDPRTTVAVAQAAPRVAVIGRPEGLRFTCDRDAHTKSSAGLQAAV